MHSAPLLTTLSLGWVPSTTSDSPCNPINLMVSYISLYSFYALHCTLLDAHFYRLLLRTFFWIRFVTEVPSSELNTQPLIPYFPISLLFCLHCKTQRIINVISGIKFWRRVWVTITHWVTITRLNLMPKEHKTSLSMKQHVDDKDVEQITLAF